MGLLYCHLRLQKPSFPFLIYLQWCYYLLMWCIIQMSPGLSSFKWMALIVLFWSVVLWEVGLECYDSVNNNLFWERGLTCLFNYANLFGKHWFWYINEQFHDKNSLNLQTFKTLHLKTPQSHLFSCYQGKIEVIHFMFAAYWFSVTLLSSGNKTNDVKI